MGGSGIQVSLHGEEIQKPGGGDGQCSWVEEEKEPDREPVGGDTSGLQDNKVVQDKNCERFSWAARVRVIMAILIGILMSMENMADNMGENKPRLVMVDGNKRLYRVAVDGPGV